MRPDTTWCESGNREPLKPDASASLGRNLLINAETGQVRSSMSGYPTNQELAQGAPNPRCFLGQEPTQITGAI